MYAARSASVEHVPHGPACVTSAPSRSACASELKLANAYEPHPPPSSRPHTAPGGGGNGGAGVHEYGSPAPGAAHPDLHGGRRSAALTLALYAGGVHARL